MVASPLRVFFRWTWRKVQQRVGGYGLLVMLLLQLILFLVFVGLSGVVGGLGGAQLPLFFLIFLAILSGHFAGQRLRWWLWAVGLVTAAVPLVFVVMGGLLPDLVHLADILLRSIGAFLRHVREGLPMNAFTFGDELPAVWLNLRQEAWVDADNVRRWVADVLAGSPAFQADAVGFVWALILYWSAFWAAIWMRRNATVLFALLPAGLALSMPMAYAQQTRTGVLALFLLGVLLLHGLVTQHENEMRWAKLDLDHAHDMRLDFSLSAMIFLAAIMMITLVVSQMNFRSIFYGLFGLERPESSAIAEEVETIGEILGLAQPTPQPPYLDAYRAGGLPRSHLLGLPPEQQAQDVMHIRVSGPGLSENTRYYWRSFVYDMYTGSGWQASETERLRFARGDEIPRPDHLYASTIRQEVTKLQSIGQQVYAAGDVISVDHPFEIAWWERNDGAFDVFAVRTQENAYIIDSHFPVLLASLLSQSGTDYPEWIADRYLALPGGGSPEVTALARRWTRGMESPYEKVQALEANLRAFPYSLDVPLPPPGVDIAEYFLFDLQRGYCDYYATAMVVMARAVGLPARFAVGYAQGTFDPGEGAYVVTGKDAHSWPEIYFPDFGWVPFEPTAGLLDIERAGEAILPGPENDGLPPLVDRTADTLHVFSIAAASFFGVGMLLAGSWWLLDRVKMTRQSPQSFYEAVLQRLFAYSHYAGLPLSDRATPAEMTSAMREYLHGGFSAMPWLRRFPGSIEDLDFLRDRIQQGLYSPRPLALPDKAEGMKMWRALRVKISWVLWRERINRFRTYLKW